jgi:predicted dehydrogenase
MKKKLRMGVVGLGGFGNKHLDYLLTRDDVEITALASTNLDKLASTGEKAPDAKRYQDPKELVLSGGVDAIVLCVPPHRHDGLEVLAAGRGLHMYVEKPLDVKLSAAEEACRAIEASGVVCAVGYQGRYENGVDAMREKLAVSPAGLIRAAWIGGEPGVAWWRDAAKSGGQVVEQSTHIADMLRYLFGEVTSVFAVAETIWPAPLEGGTVDGGSMALLRFASGAAGCLATGCFNANIDNDIGLKIFCRESQIDYRWDRGITYRTGGGAEDYTPTGRTHADALAAFVKAAKVGDASGVRSSYGDALITFRLTLAIEEAISTGREVLL